ncbi:uncharacterized protein FN964_007973 [Alca torda]
MELQKLKSYILFSPGLILFLVRCFMAELLPTATAVQIGSGQGVGTSLITSCKEKSEGEQEPPVPVPSGFLAIRHGASRDVPSICPVPCVTALPLFLAICVEGMTVIFLTARKKKRYSSLPAGTGKEGRQKTPILVRLCREHTRGRQLQVVDQLLRKRSSLNSHAEVAVLLRQRNTNPRMQPPGAGYIKPAKKNPLVFSPLDFQTAGTSSGSCRPAPQA